MQQRNTTLCQRNECCQEKWVVGVKCRGNTGVLRGKNEQVSPFSTFCTFHPWRVCDLSNISQVGFQMVGSTSICGLPAPRWRLMVLEAALKSKHIKNLDKHHWWHQPPRMTFLSPIDCNVGCNLQFGRFTEVLNLTLASTRSLCFRILFFFSSNIAFFPL